MAKTSQLQRESRMPFSAAAFASSKRRSPSLRESSELMPMPVPMPTAMMRFCTGKASDTAVSAFSPICATKMLSTML